MTLLNFPYPPSVNQLYAGKSRRYKSKIAKKYSKDVDEWILHNIPAIIKVKAEVAHWDWIEVGMQVCVPRGTLFTKKDTVKEWDVANRLKAAHDALSLVLDIDDRYFHVGKTKPYIDDQGPYINFILKPSDITEAQSPY